MLPRTVWHVCAVCAMAIVSMGSVASAVDIETVYVGNAGNADDTHNAGYGAVDYVYRIGKYEVTAGQYAEFLNAVAGVDTYGLYNESMWTSNSGCKIERYEGSGTEVDPYAYRVAEDWANRPVNYVSWGDAARFANWLHNDQQAGPQDATTTEDGAYLLNGATSDTDLIDVAREADWTWAIPTEDEWYKAAYYDPAADSYYDYPTGTDDQPSHELIDPDPGNNATFVTELELTIGSPYFRTEAGAHENSASPSGTFDQGGNVWEWHEAIPFAQTTWRGVRGGSYNYDTHNEMRADRDLWGRSPSAEDASVGFRVAQIPEPGSLAIVALGCVGLLRRRGA